MPSLPVVICWHIQYPYQTDLNKKKKKILFELKFVCWLKNLPLKHSNNLDLNPDQDQKTNSGISINTFRIRQTGFIFFLCHWRISCSGQFLLILFFKYFFIVRVRARTGLNIVLWQHHGPLILSLLVFFMSGYVCNLWKLVELFSGEERVCSPISSGPESGHLRAAVVSSAVVPHGNIAGSPISSGSRYILMGVELSL